MLRALLSNGMPVPPGFATLRAHQGQQSALRRDVCLHEIEHDGFRVSAWKDGSAGRETTYLPISAFRGPDPPAVMVLHQRRRGGPVMATSSTHSTAVSSRDSAGTTLAATVSCSA